MLRKKLENLHSLKNTVQEQQEIKVKKHKRKQQQVGSIIKEEKKKSQSQIQTMKVLFNQSSQQQLTELSLHSSNDISSLQEQICSILSQYQKMKERIAELEEELGEYKKPLQSALQV